MGILHSLLVLLVLGVILAIFGLLFFGIHFTISFRRKNFVGIVLDLHLIFFLNRLHAQRGAQCGA